MDKDIKTAEELDKVLKLSEQHVEQVREAARNLGGELNAPAAAGHRSGYYKGYMDAMLKYKSQSLPIENEVVRDKFYDFLQVEKNLGISDKKTVERIEWYWVTYFKSTPESVNDLIFDIDTEAARLEDVLHGEEGKIITNIRYMIINLQNKIK